MSARRKRETGATMVEFAIILPIFVALLFGIIELGLAFYNRTVVDDATQAGGRVGAAVGNDIDVDLFVLETIGSEVDQLPNGGVGIVKFVEIFEVNAAGNPTSELNFYEYTYTPDPTQCDWSPCPQGSTPANYNGWTWRPDERSVKVGDLDTIGVKVYFAHNWITGVIPGGDRDCTRALRTSTCWIEETSLRLEPLQFDVGN
ncbi:MAG: TadE/TadG family type IV pilus assembly protein [Acidimicrobiia bacterium]